MLKISWLQAALLSASALSMRAALAQPAPVPLLGHWAMEPGAGNTLAVRNADYAIGKVGQALRLRGDSDVSLGDAGLINRAGAALTISLWLKLDAYPAGNGAGLLAKRAMNVAMPFSLTVGVNGELGFEGYNGADWSSNLFSQPRAIPVGEWAHVAATFKAGDKLRLFVNGKVVAEKGVERALAGNDQPLVFGRDPNRGALSGLLDEVRLYAVALSPEQIQADSEGKVTTRGTTEADFPIPTHLVRAALARYDMPLGFTEGMGRTRATAERKAGPDAIDWPRIRWGQQTLFEQNAQQSIDVRLRDGAEARPLFQQASDEVLEPGNHWFRPLQWLWGRRYIYAADRAARSLETDYELWAFPITIQGAGQSDVRDVVLRCDGQVLYESKEPLRSLTLLLPQNEKGKPYQLWVAGRGPVSFDAGLKPIVSGNPREEVIPLSATVPGVGPKITVQNLARPQSFPAQQEWDADIKQQQILLASTRTTDVLARRLAESRQVLAGAPAQSPTLVADYAMEPDKSEAGKSEAARSVDLGPLGLDGQLLDGALFTSMGRRDNALQLNGGRGRLEAKSAALDKMSDALTIALWARVDQLPAGGSAAAIVSKRRSVYVAAPFSLTVNDRGGLNLSSHDGAKWSSLGTEPVLKPGAWTHLALTMQKGGEAILYADGKAVSRTNIAGIGANEEPLTLGYEEGADFQGGGRSGFQGALDEVQIYAEALSPEQVQSAMAGTLVARAPAGAARAPRAVLAAAPTAQDAPSTSLNRYLGLQVPRSAVTVNSVNLPHGMSGGHFSVSLHTPDKVNGGGAFPGSAEDYAKYLGSTGYDRAFEDTAYGQLNDTDGPRSRDRLAQSMARVGVQLGLVPDTAWKRPFLGHPNLAFFASNLPDYRAPLYRDLQISMQHLGRYNNLAGVSIGADNGAYVSFWDWAPPEPGRPWAEAFLNWTGGKSDIPEGKSVGGKSSAREFVDYIGRYNQTFTSYGYFARALREISPSLVTTTGSFGSSPGVGARGGWPWASVPGKEIYSGVGVQQAYDWDETRVVKPLANVALVDRLRSYDPAKTTWTIIDDFFLKHSREARQRDYALALSRGVDAVGTAWIAQPSGPFARPQIVADQKETYAWAHRLGGAYAKTQVQASIGVLFVQPQALLRRVNQNAKASDAELLAGSHEGKTTEALFLCHAAGWPAKIITPEELRRGLPASMKAVLLVGLDSPDDTWHWFDGLGDEMKKFTASGGRLLLDNESTLPPGMAATKTEMAVRAYITQGDGGTDNASSDMTQALFERNRDNIARLQLGMNGIAAPLAASGEPTIWAIPHQTGDVQYVSAINMGYEPGKSATQFVKPQAGALKWSTARPIYDVRAARKLSADEAGRVDLTKDAFQLYALPPSPVTAPQVLAARGADGFYTATVSVGAQPMRGVPVQVLVARGTDSATVYGASGSAIKLPLSDADAGTFTITATELLSGLSGKAQVKTTGSRALLDSAATQARALELARFASRKEVPLVVALTPEQTSNAQTSALARKLVEFYTKSGRKAELGRVEPNGVILSLQPLRGAQKFPQWKTVDADMILLGQPMDNVLLLDQERGMLLPPLKNLKAGQAVARITYSPFVGERNVLNLLATDAAGLAEAVGRVTRVSQQR